MIRSSRLVELTAVSVAFAAVALVPGGSAEAARDRLLAVQIVGGGTVTSRDRRLECTGRCTVSYATGRVVTLDARPAAAFQFVRWEGGCVGAAGSCLLALDRRASVRAVFERERATVRVSVGGPGDVTSEPPGLSCGASSSNCSAAFGLDTTIQLFAAPRPGSELHSWGDGCQRTGPTSCLLVVRGTNEVAAAFRRTVPPSGAQVLQIDNPGSAEVTSDPPGIDCPPTCTASFDPHVLVRLRGVGVIRWRGACVGGTDRCNVVVDAPTVVGVDSPPPGQPPGPPAPPPARRYGLQVSVSGPGVVTGSSIRCGAATSRAADCQGFFPPNVALTLRASAGRKGRFGGWGGFCTGKRTRCTVFVTTNKDVMAIFRRRRGR